MDVTPVHHTFAAPGPDPQANFERIHAWAQAASEAGASLLLTPELFVTAEGASGSAVLRERLRTVAVAAGVGLIACTVETSGQKAFIGAHWWDAQGALVAHTRKHHLAHWQKARGFSPWDGVPPIIPESVYSLPAIHGPVALTFSADVTDPSIAYYLRDHGVRTILALDEAGTQELASVNTGRWAPKNMGVPFPQSGPLPEPLLRPLPRVADSWWAGQGPRQAADYGS